MAGEVPVDTGGRRFLGDLTKLVSGTTLAQIIGIAAAPVLTRLFAPEAFGVFAVFTSIVAVIGVAACLRYDLAVMLPDDDVQAASLLLLCILLSGLVAVACLPLVYAGGGWVVASTKAESLGGLVWLVPVSVFLTGMFLALNAWGSRVGRYGRLSATRVTQTMTATSSQLAAGGAGFGTATALVWSSLLGQVVAAVLLFVTMLGGRWATFVAGARPAALVAVARRYRRFPTIELPGAFVNALSQNAPFLLLAYFFSQSVVGHFSLTYRLIALPITLVGGALAQVYYQRASAIRKDQAALADLTESVFRRLFAFVLLPSVVLGLTGPELFAVVFGERWATAGVYAAILAPWIVAWLPGSTLNVIFAVRERQDQALVVHMVLMVFRIVPLVVGGVIGDAVLALILFSISNTLVYAWVTVWSMKVAGVAPGRVVRDARAAIPATVVAATVFLGLEWASVPAVVRVAAAVTVVIGHLVILALRDPAWRSRGAA